MEVSDVEALRSAAGLAALAAASDPGEPLALATRLRAAGHDPHLVSLALTQQRLRRSAAGKLGSDAAEMLFTIDAVEQATGVRPPLPAHLADLFDRPERVAMVPNDLAAVETFIHQAMRA